MKSTLGLLVLLLSLTSCQKKSPESGVSQNRQSGESCSTQASSSANDTNAALCLTTDAVIQPDPDAESRPGIYGQGGNQNSSGVSLSNDIEMKWALNFDAQTLEAGTGTAFNYSGSIRSKNIMIRDRTIAVLTPSAGSTDWSFIDAKTGSVVKRHPSGITRGYGSEWNRTGVQGRDVRMGQIVGFWHSNGFIYFRSGGDATSNGRFRVSDGEYIVKNGATTSTSSSNVNFANFPLSDANASAYPIMADNSNWYIHTPGGHQGLLSTGFKVFDLNATPLANGTSAPVTSTTLPCTQPCPTFAKASTMLMDGDWVYVIGTTAHPDLGWSNYTDTNGTNRRQWLGTRIRGIQFGGQVPTKAAGTGVQRFNWSVVDSFIGHDTDLASSIKPVALGKSHIFAVTQSGVSHTATDANVDFSKPLVLNAINRTNGALAFSRELSITGAGNTIDKYFGFNGAGSTWRPQIAYIDQTDTNGKEYVAVLLPESSSAVGWIDPVIPPYTTPAEASTRLAVISTTDQAELWSYQYAHGVTTPIWNLHNATNTKMTIAGNAVYVGWVKSATNLANYIDATSAYDLTLYVDRFDLTSGTKTSFSFPLGVKGNTLQLDDLIAADGQIHALVTYREWVKTGAAKGGAQVLVTLGDKQADASSQMATTGVTASPVTALPITASPVTASPVTAGISGFPTASLSVTAVDPENMPLTYTWNKYSGPGGVVFSANGAGDATQTAASFDYPGTYILECRISNGQSSITSKVTVQIPAPLTTVTSANGVISTFEANAPVGTVKFTRAGGDLSKPLSINLKIEGTAKPGVDYQAIPTTATFPAGISTIFVNVTPIADSLTESNETVIVTALPSRDYSYSLPQWVAPYWSLTTLTKTVTIKNGAAP